MMVKLPEAAQPASTDNNVTSASARTKKISRVIAGIVLIVYGVYHLAVQYYSGLDSRLLLPSRHGLTALVCYESGNYGRAAYHWRRHYGLTYDPVSVPLVTKNLQEQISKEPAKMESYYLRADLFFNTGNYADAAAVYQSALTQKPYDYEAKVGLASCLAIQGDYKKAQAVFADLLRQNYQGSNITSFLNVLTVLDHLERAKNQECADRYLTLAYVNRYLRIIDVRRQVAVIAYADKALACDGRLDEAHFCKGVMYIKQEQYREALEEFDRVLAINPANADAYHRMGFIHGVLGNPEQELASYRKAASIEKKDPLFAYKLGELLRKKYGDIRQANHYFKMAYELNPADFQSLAQYGYTLLLLHEYDQSLAVAAFMIGKYPARPYGYKLKADCYMGLKQYQDAVTFYLQSHEVAERAGIESELDFQAFNDLGKAYEKLKKPADAIAAYKRALAIKPYDVTTLYTLQYLYRGQGKYAEAYAAVKEILRLQPNHAGAQRVLPYLQRNVTVGNAG